MNKKLFMKKNKIKNIFILINILFLLYYNYLIQIFFVQTNLINYKPKISVIMPIYNGGKYLYYSLKSVQNQKMNDIEIIIVNDNSKDNSSKIVRRLIKKDKRIKLIENKENRRILFSKSIGALNCKGKYILEIDQDDRFINDNAFDILYNVSEQYESDILNFKWAHGEDVLNLSKIENYINNKNILYETKNKLKPNIAVLWGNLIKTDLYKRVLYNLWPIIINYKIIFQEDYLVTFFILILAKKYETIGNTFYYYFISKKQVSNGFINNSEYYLSVIFAGIIFYDYFIDLYPNYFNNIINYIKFLKHEFKVIKKLYPSLFKYFFEKIFTNTQLLNLDKKYLIKQFNIQKYLFSHLYLTSDEINNIINSISNSQTNIYNEKYLSELSIVIVFSNFEKISKLIKSINYQNFNNLEVIIIYDGENEKQLNLLNNYIQSFNYIKLISNPIKKGKVYSISRGVLISKGKYIMILDENYFFSNKYSFQFLCNKIKEYDLDILEFDIYKIIQNKYKILYKCHHFISQFNLSIIKYNLEFNEIDIKPELMTNKIFKTKYLQDIIIQFKLDQFNEIIDAYSNNIFSFLISSNNHKFNRTSSIHIYINDIDYEKIKFKNFTADKINIVNETITYINFIFFNSKSTYNCKEKILKEFINVLSIVFNKFTKVSKSSLTLLNRFIVSDYISIKNKKLLKFYYRSLIN